MTTTTNTTRSTAMASYASIALAFALTLLAGCGNIQVVTSGADAGVPPFGDGGPPDSAFTYVPAPGTLASPLPELGLAPSSGPTAILANDACVTDSDCVPDSPCHATSCVAPAHQSAGSGICTLDCQSGTLDCGGSCLCQAGHCAAQLVDLGAILRGDPNRGTL